MAAKLKLIDTGKIKVYDPTGNVKLPIEAKTGDVIHWKRNGTRGIVKAKIIGFSDLKPKYVFIQNYTYDMSASSGNPVWIKISSIFNKIKEDGTYDYPEVTN